MAVTFLLGLSKLFKVIDNNVGHVGKVIVIFFNPAVFLCVFGENENIKIVLVGRIGIGIHSPFTAKTVSSDNCYSVFGVSKFSKKSGFGKL